MIPLAEEECIMAAIEELDSQGVYIGELDDSTIIVDGHVDIRSLIKTIINTYER